MKVAIVTTGLLDCLLPLAKHLSEHVSLDLYVSVSGEKFAESVGVFDLSGLPNGLVDEETTARIIGPQLMEYANSGKGRVRVRLFKYPSLKVFNRTNFKLHRVFARELNSRKYDVVHLNGYRGSQMFLYGFLKRAIGKVWTVHDPILHSGEDKWQTRFAYRLYRWLKAHFILHNRTQRPEFIKLYGINPARVHYIPFGPLEVFQVFRNGERQKQEEASVLFWGRISPYKGVENLVQAAKTASKEVPGLRVVVAGKPNYPIDTSELTTNPTFTFKNGFVENPDLVKMIERSSLVVCPYTDATQSGVIMTAYAFNKPVLATAVGGIPEVVEDGVTGRLVPPKDSRALSRALVEMLQNPEELDRMSENIKQMNTKGRLSWQKIATETTRVYEQALR